MLQLTRFAPFGKAESWRRAAGGFCSFLQRALKQTAQSEAGSKGKGEKADGYAEELKEVYRQLLQLQLKAENYAVCVQEMCDLLLARFEGKLV